MARTDPTPVQTVPGPTASLSPSTAAPPTPRGSLPPQLLSPTQALAPTQAQSHGAGEGVMGLERGQTQGIRSPCVIKRDRLVIDQRKSLGQVRFLKFLAHLSAKCSRWAFVMAHCPSSVNNFFKQHLLWNPLLDFDQISQEWSLGGPIPNLFKPFQLVALVGHGVKS